VGKVQTKIKVQNWFDLEKMAWGERVEPARFAEVDALIDTGATGLYLRASVVQMLGLRPVSKIVSRTMSDRQETRRVFAPVDLEILGRSARFDVIELPDALPNIVGQIPLEALDWVVDCRSQKLIPNPAHQHGELSDEY
jgi:predicted aspartyl protease